MKDSALFSKLLIKLENNKKFKWIAYAVLILAALLIFISSIKASWGKSTIQTTPTDPQGGQTDIQTYTERLEARLESILSGMQGVGKVRVMIMLDGTEETVVASEEQSSENENGTSKYTKPSIISSSMGDEAIVLKELLPKVGGVLVVAEGAGDISVSLDIMSAVSTVLGINQNNVQVFEMNEKSVED